MSTLDLSLVYLYSVMSCGCQYRRRLWLQWYGLEHMNSCVHYIDQLQRCVFLSTLYLLIHQLSTQHCSGRGHTHLHSRGSFLRIEVVKRGPYVWDYLPNADSALM